MTHTSRLFDCGIYDDQIKVRMDYIFCAPNVITLLSQTVLAMWVKWENVRIQ
jgi:hypothetical protein